MTRSSPIPRALSEVVFVDGVEHRGHHPIGAGADLHPRVKSKRLVDPAALNMGNTAGNLHDRYAAITKDRTDAYAVASQEKLAAAYARGRIQPDLVPVATAGNAAGLNDGATAALPASADAAAELGLPARMRLVNCAFAGVEPEAMGIGPVPATQKALENAGLGIGDIGLIEIDEAFAIQVLSFLDHYGIAGDDPRVNGYGGAIAVGHPLAAATTQAGAAT